MPEVAAAARLVVVTGTTVDERVVLKAVVATGMLDVEDTRVVMSDLVIEETEEVATAAEDDAAITFAAAPAAEEAPVAKAPEGEAGDQKTAGV